MGMTALQEALQDLGLVSIGGLAVAENALSEWRQCPRPYAMQRKVIPGRDVEQPTRAEAGVVGVSMVLKLRIVNGESHGPAHRPLMPEPQLAEHARLQRRDVAAALPQLPVIRERSRLVSVTLIPGLSAPRCFHIGITIYLH
jgi:hypothetical protein